MHTHMFMPWNDVVNLFSQTLDIYVVNLISSKYYKKLSTREAGAFFTVLRIWVHVNKTVGSAVLQHSC